jgi:hypothetical protein
MVKIRPTLEIINYAVREQNLGYPESDFALEADSDQKQMNPTQENRWRIQSSITRGSRIKGAKHPKQGLSFSYLSVH